ncbi:MAG: HPr family phosphocarrier protein [Kyrpidia sp.]|nr:HPr family phosphocarrier protein [Kyrpidia sp.]
MEKTVVVTNATGLHARPAALFVETARKYRSDIRVEANGKRADGKSLLNLLVLGVTAGQDIRIIAEGPDEEEALGALVRLIESRFGEAAAREGGSDQ